MRRFDVGDKVRIDIPNSADPDYSLHGSKGTVVEIIEDDADKETGDVRDSYLFSVELDDDSIEHLRWRDLRPASE
ncbi:hypothetical protein KM295_16225 [Natronomonas sp. F2-12]|uniref:DUF8139 domain-containing protein n=1 Tax=Natronomonas aquatica TaxID=2841590 RepID=A0A9R1CTK8_9EURY|nr:hypothetical protein [Natronomonas aquatica]MCQ4334999.1 hypothetical protein [Natronomonas aquatica]